MIDPKLLEILVCPETKEPVAIADAAALERLNRAIRRGDARNLSGETVREPVTEALLRADGRILYPVREGVPIMLVDESIDVSDL